MNENNSIAGALAAIEELRIDSKIGKSKHFSASDRKLIYHRICGLPVIIANLFVGIVLVNLQGSSSAAKALVSEAQTGMFPKALAEKLPVFFSSEWLALVTIFFAFAAASLSAVQTFFNFHKASEGHRAIGNRYVHISRQCKATQQKHRDKPFSVDAVWPIYENLYNEYHQINTEAEAFPTNSADLKKAKSAAEISPYKNPHST